jgi:hypothetical protein
VLSIPSLHPLFLVLILFLTQKLIEHHEAKDQFLRVAVKRLTETQLFKDELKEVSELNTALLARHQELEA